MEDNVVKIEDFHKETKKRELKEKVRSKIQNGKEWFARNKEAVIALTPVIIGGITTVAKVVGKRSNLHKEGGAEG